MNKNLEAEPSIKNELIASLKEKLFSIIHNADLKRKLEIMDELANFGESLREKYPNYADFKLFHVLAGSTFLDEMPEFDFPGDDSVEKFIKERL